MGGQLAGAMAGWTVCSIITPVEHVKGTSLILVGMTEIDDVGGE